MSFLFVALGGALGAMGRYAVSLIPLKIGFPLQTFVTNIIGAAVIGFIAGVASHNANVSQNTILFWKTGVCGGFTTFSTFSLEACNLLEQKLYCRGGIYIALSIICCMAGVVCGKRLSLVLKL